MSSRIDFIVKHSAPLCRVLRTLAPFGLREQGKLDFAIQLNVSSSVVIARLRRLVKSLYDLPSFKTFGYQRLLNESMIYPLMTTVTANGVVNLLLGTLNNYGSTEFLRMRETLLSNHDPIYHPDTNDDDGSVPLYSDHVPGDTVPISEEQMLNYIAPGVSAKLDGTLDAVS